MENLESIHKTIGRPVVSLETAKRLGSVKDLLVDPLAGELAGLSVCRPDKTIALASVLDLHGIGRDAVVVESDESLVLAEASPLNSLPKAKQNLIGVRVITEHGELLGRISSLILYVDRRPLFIYEVRTSLFNALLGRALYFAASLGCAFAEDGSSLVVTAGPEQMHDRPEAAAGLLWGSYGSPLNHSGAVRVEVRTHAE